MSAVASIARHQFRRRRRGWLAALLLVGVLAGIVLAATAGARRTATAYDRFLHATHGADVLVSPNGTGFDGFYDRLGHLPGVETVTPIAGFGGTDVRRHRAFMMESATDGRYGATVERPQLTAGRLPRSGSDDEVLASPAAVRTHDLHVGQTFPVRFAAEGAVVPDPAHDPVVALHVVGIGVTRDSVVPVNSTATGPILISGPGLARRLGPDYRGFDGAAVVLRPGASRSAFGARAQQLAKQFPATGGGLFVADLHEQAAKVDDALRPTALGLGLFAVIAGFVALCAVGLVVARQIYLVAGEYPALRAIGATRGQLVLAALAQTAVIAVPGAVLAVATAIALSPLSPIGSARRAEPDPGVTLDWTVLGVGLLAVVAAVLLVALIASRRLSATTRSTPVRRPSWLGRQAARLGAAPSVTVGVGYAVDPGQGRSALPTRGAVLGVGLAIALLIAATMFGADLARFVDTPRQYGQTWDVTEDVQFSQISQRDLSARLARERGVTAWTFGGHLDLAVNHHAVPGVALTAGRGPLLAPAVLEGRSADRAGTIALGTHTLDRVRGRPGRTVTVTPLEGGPDHTTHPRVVGRAVFPYFGLGSFTPAGLGVGAQIQEHLEDADTNLVLVRIAPGAHHDADVARVAAHLRRGAECNAAAQCTVTTATRPVDVRSYAHVVTTPLALGVLMALIGMITLAYLLVASFSRRRSELAVLRTLGFTRRQLVATLAVQATTIVLLALLLGVPVGLIVGRGAWSAFATAIGIGTEVATPTWVLLTIPAGLLVANLIALGPAWRAGRLRAASCLRVE